ncbi:MAG TPA: GNAT family N-acetyltransferase [Terriglobia bacterium]|nr:GNAT family N-acetyltransferase [Terriglobia bacterium]
MNLIFRRLDNNCDVPMQRELYLEAFPEQKGTALVTDEYYHWKFRDFPFRSPPPQQFVAVEEHQVVAYFAALTYPYILSNNNCMSGIICDIMTHSRVRRRGVFGELGSIALSEFPHEGIDLAMAFPIRPASLSALNKLGLETICHLPVWILPISWRGLLRDFRIFGPAAKGALEAYRHIVRPRILPGFTTEVLPHVSFFERASQEPSLRGEFDSLVERWRARLDFALQKDLKFYRWRLSAPGSKYFIHLLKTTVGGLAGLAVTRISDLKGIRSCAILDMMIPEQRFGAQVLLLDSVRAHAIKEHAELLATIVPKSAAQELHLTRYGFIRSPMVFKCVTRIFNSSFKVDLKRISHQMMWIDSDDL